MRSNGPKMPYTNKTNKTSIQMKDMPAPIKIYVGNIPLSARNSELKELFEKFGKVAECDILKDFAFVFGFVHMEDKNDAKMAIVGLHDYAHLFA